MDLLKIDFTQRLLTVNGLNPDDVKCWLFCPGMLFNSPDKWWGDLSLRDFPHEGVDFCLYRDHSGKIVHLDHTTRIPVMHTGTVRALFTDFLGQAVIIEHETDQKRKYLSVYAHTTPRSEIRPGVTVHAGDVIANIADTSRSKAGIHPHLHISFGIPTPDLIYEPFIWNCMRDPGLVALLDPLHILDWPWELQENGWWF